MSTLFLTPTLPATFYYTTSSPSPPVPSAPTGLSHSNVTTMGWTESWNAVSGANTYNVYVNGSIVQSGITGTSYTVSGRSPSTTYSVTVTAVNAQGESVQSTADSVTTEAATGVDITRIIQLQASVPAPTTPQSFTMYQGDSVTLQVTVTANGSPLNLTGMTVKWLMLPSATSTYVTASKQIGSGITITNAANGVFEVTLASTDTAGEPPLIYFHQARLTDAYGHEEIIMQGGVTLQQSSSLL